MNKQRYAVGRRAALGMAIAAASFGRALPARAQPAAPTAEQWKEIEAAAEAEGTLTLYNNITPPGAELLVEVFREDYPNISVEATRFASAALIERFSTEYAAGRHIVDACITIAEERLFELMRAGAMAAWYPPELAAFPAAVNYENRFTMFHVDTAREALIWNTQTVRPEDAPKEWADLFDPKWKGKVGINPPWRSAGPQGVIALWEQLGLGDTAAKLKSNDVRFFEGSGGILQAVIRGDIVIAEISDLPLNVALDDGAPIGVLYPNSGTVMSPGYAFVAEKAPHPNAARVFVNWVMSARGQEALQRFAGLPATRPGVPPLQHLPATDALSNIVVGLSLTPPAKQKEIVDHWRGTFGVQ